ncbi:cell wall-binding repeat-containing protein [Leifsonia sp. Root227]|uniref:cell wall-binding repeat-containing protein n=1 Tax=Leifsonia sp. Root227 TaxID=1736496 RepID=UPI000AADD185|nr:cell wall-binding repeat-containing protein [Leifsonia sp. Root227]
MRRSILAAAALFAVVASACVVAQPAIAATANGTAVLAGLPVAAPVQTTTYNRSLFPTWADADHDGCNTRAEVLQAQTTVPVTYTTATGCTVATGNWNSWYDAQTWKLASDVDIDHLVPLKEAWISGAWAWTTAQRQEYANDLSIPYALQAVTDNINQSKSDKDPAAWMPPSPAAACQYAQDWVLVKYKWGLAVDTAEQAKLASLFATGGCGAQQLTLPATAVTSSGATVQRIAGADRFDTSVAISQSGYPSGSSVAYLATGTNYADALSAAPAAAAQGGPLLLTTPGALPASVASELARLKPTRIVIVGGTSVVSSTVERQAHSFATQVDRIAGSDRFATSRAVSAAAFPSATTAFIATGRNFPDALSAAAAAGASGSPVVLVDGAAGAADGQTMTLLRGMGVGSVVIAGGTSAVSAGIANTLSSLAPVTRLSGGDRYETSNAINANRFPTASRVYFATGSTFADALAGAALAGRDGSPLFVVPSGCLPPTTAATIATYGAVGRVLLGGPNALSNAVGSGTVCAPPPPPPAPPAPPVPPAPPANPGNGATALCNDGTYSYAAHHQGACSHHGGVAVFYK